MLIKCEIIFPDVTVQHEDCIDIHVLVDFCIDSLLIVTVFLALQVTQL